MAETLEAVEDAVDILEKEVAYTHPRKVAEKQNILISDALLLQPDSS